MAQSKRTKALAIPKEVKEAVWKRQKGKSLFAPYQPISVEECCCHYIPRSRGGLGIEQNIFGCTMSQHRLFDNNVLKTPWDVKSTNLKIEEMHTVVRNHFKLNYKDWNEDDLIYRKYGRKK